MEAEKPWYKRWPETVPKNVEIKPTPLHRLLADTAKKFPNKVAVYFFDTKLTFRDLDVLSWKFANVLRHLGARKGDRVALFLPNCPQFLICYYGALKAGCCVVPFNPRYKEHEIVFQMNDSEAEIVVALDAVYDELKKARDKTRLKHVIITHMIDYLPPLYRMFASAKGVQPRSFPNTLEMEELMGKVRAEELEVEADPIRDVATILYTGGTTGVPKGAMLTHYNLYSNVVQLVHWSNVSVDKDVVLAVLPFFHSYGMTACMNVPITVGIPAVQLPRFDVRETLEAIEKYKPTIFPGVPTIYISILNYKDLKSYNLKSIRLCVSGAAPLPEEVAKKWREVTGGMIVEGYGLTETSPVTHCNPLDDISKVKYGSIGIPISNTEAKVVDPDDWNVELKPGEIGEIAVKGPQVMIGYWKRPDETAKTLRDGWLYTGDMGFVDEDGYFHVVDRKKEMINVGGLKALPRDIEEVIYQHPAVKMAAVIGIPDPRLGEVPKAYVVLKEGHEGKVTAEGIIAFCKERLAGYKVPRQVEFRKDLPTSLVGKVLRRVLREELGKTNPTPT